MENNNEELHDSDRECGYGDFFDDEYNLSEEDDKLYEINVDDDVERSTMSTSIICPSSNAVVNDLSETESGDLNLCDDFASLDDSSELDDGNKMPKFQAFKPITGKQDPIFELGMLFKNRAQFVGAVRQHSILQGKDIRFKKNEPSRVRATCREGCKWMIYASGKRDQKKTLQVKTYFSQHNCGRIWKNRLVNSSWLAMIYLEEFKINPTMPVTSLIEKVQTDFNVKVSASQVYKAKQKATRKLEGSFVAQYAKLWEYCHEIAISNPGTSVHMHFKPDLDGMSTNIFQRIYVCWGALKRGFKEGCRQIIGVDGCHLTTRHGGQLLTAVGIDGNNQIFPVAYVMVEVENTSSWLCFLQYLISDLGISNERTWTIISDKQKGLEHAILELLPCVEHMHCVRHLHNNFKSAGFTGKALKERLWRLATASYVGKFTWEMEELKKYDPLAFQWLVTKDPAHWSRSYFTDSTKCDILLNNLCESFNAAILQARDKPILTMLERIRMYLMDRLTKRRSFTNKWPDDLGPKIHTLIEINNQKASSYIPALAGDMKFEVRGMHGDQFVVDLQLKTCSCRRWDLTGIPCEHAISVIWELMEEPEAYVDNCYAKETFQKSYNHIMQPINGVDMWLKINKPAIIPPQYSKQPERPKKSRRKEVDEAPKTKHKLRRFAKALTCRRCGQKGHNLRTCKADLQAPPPPPFFEA